MSRGITVFRSFPKELFRVNNGAQVFVRNRSDRPSYDIVAHQGWVKPLALDPMTYRAPNGASMRPNSPYQQRLVSQIFKGPDVLVFSVPAETPLPRDLLLVHERSDHYSLQPAEQMTLLSLNDKITDFLHRNAKVYEKQQWLKAYPKPTEHVGERF